MAPREKAWRDWVYLWIIGTQLFGMLGKPSNAQSTPYPYHHPRPRPLLPKIPLANPQLPLHFLISLRKAYVSFSGDPFFAHDNTHAPFLQIFLYIEGLVQLPLAAYLVYQLASRKPTTGPTELAGLAFGCVTGMGSAACFYELLHMGPELVSEDKKASLVYGTYLPFLVIPSLLAVDMYTRLLPRVQEPISRAKTQ
ncbi:hypothetical protein PT974_09614 [Cladobotryum mycophilum]|uniref:EXPERA domain-containing protein n=1 Tax=Cladobotryum mycophilum TaxID=491253 RepID=A0ABR0SGM4_9HYPO